jgi:hypothetical protein
MRCSQLPYITILIKNAWAVNADIRCICGKNQANVTFDNVSVFRLKNLLMCFEARRELVF